MCAFFVRGFPTTQGKGVSIKILKERLFTVIKNGDRQGIFLSDKKIAEELNAGGIEIGRRTVNKYRGEMNIPDSRTRKAGANWEVAAS